MSVFLWDSSLGMRSWSKPASLATRMTAGFCAMNASEPPSTMKSPIFSVMSLPPTRGSFSTSVKVTFVSLRSLEHLADRLGERADHAGVVVGHAPAVPLHLGEQRAVGREHVEVVESLHVVGGEAHGADDERREAFSGRGVDDVVQVGPDPIAGRPPLALEGEEPRSGHARPAERLDAR